MKKILIALLLPMSAIAQSQPAPSIQESMTPVTKHDAQSIAFTISSQSVQPVIMKLDRLIEQRDMTQQQVTQLQAQLVKLNKMIDDARAAGVKTLDEVEAEEKAAYDAQEAIKAAKVLESAASVKK